MTDKTRETKSEPLGLRVTPAVRRALEKAAADDHRPLASYVDKILVEHLKGKGYLK